MYPKGRIYTFWNNADYFRRNAGFRMDFLLLNGAAAACLEPVWVTLRDMAIARGASPATGK